LSEKAATAKKIVSLLVRNGVKAGDSTQNATITEWATKIGLEGRALNEALIAAGGLNWIEDGPRVGTVTLTKEGYDAAEPS
jgi:hypothetical protein